MFQLELQYRAACHIISRGNRTEYVEAKNKVKVEGMIE